MQEPTPIPAELAPTEVEQDGVDADYWDALIDKSEAAYFLKLAGGTLDNYRQAGTGPQFIRISARCIRYTRRLCKKWYDDRLRSSTSDPGPDKAAA